MFFHKVRKKPILPIRLVLQLASFVMCLLLIASMLATVLVEDLLALTSSGGIQTILSSLTESKDEPVDPALFLPASSGGLTQLSNTTTQEEEETEEDSSDENQHPGTTELPADILTNPDALAEYLHSIAQNVLGEEVDVTAEQVQTFINESTVMDFVSDKVSSYINDALTGEQNASFTAQDIMDLIEENQALLEETFQIKLTEEAKAEMYAQVDQAVTEADLDNTIRGSINEIMNTPVPGMENTSMGELLQKVGKFARVETLVGAIIVCVALSGFIMFLNYYNPPRGLRQIAGACTFTGLFMAAPLVVIHFYPELLLNTLPELADLLHVLDGFYLVMAPYHYAPLVFGLILTAVSIVWRIFFNAQMKRQMASA